MRSPYPESTVFSVPLENGGFARGVVARADSKGKILLGYFFGPRLPNAGVGEIEDLHADAAILCVRFGALGLINGEWFIHGQLPDWNRAEWPMPDFVRLDMLGKRSPVSIRYSDSDPSHLESEVRITDAKEMPRDGLCGYGYVEITLAKLLGSKEGDK